MKHSPHLHSPRPNSPLAPSPITTVLRRPVIVLNFNSIPISLCKHFQNVEVNLESWSKMIVEGTPCTHTMT